MEVPCPRMLSNKQHPLTLTLDNIVARRVPYMSLTSKSQQKKVRTLEAYLDTNNDNDNDLAMSRSEKEEL